jgi:hypothetical protein
MHHYKNPLAVWNYTSLLGDNKINKISNNKGKFSNDLTYHAGSLCIIQTIEEANPLKGFVQKLNMCNTERSLFFIIIANTTN